MRFNPWLGLRSRKGGNEPMRIRRRAEIPEDELFRFAKSYLSEAFPNPQRIGCPPDHQLTLQAEHPQETDPTVIRQVTSFSPFFLPYMEVLADLKRRKAV